MIYITHGGCSETEYSYGFDALLGIGLLSGKHMLGGVLCSLLHIFLKWIFPFWRYVFVDVSCFELGIVTLCTDHNVIVLVLFVLSLYVMHESGCAS